MFKKHQYSPNHKIVTASPHNFNQPAPAQGGGGPPQESHVSAEPAGGGAQGPAPQMFDDGGYTGAPSKMSMAKDAIGTSVSDWKDKLSSSQAPTARSGNDNESYEGKGGQAFNSSVDKAVSENE